MYRYMVQLPLSWTTQEGNPKNKIRGTCESPWHWFSSWKIHQKHHLGPQLFVLGYEWNIPKNWTTKTNRQTHWECVCLFVWLVVWMSVFLIITLGLINHSIHHSPSSTMPLQGEGLGYAPMSGHRHLASGPGFVSRALHCNQSGCQKLVISRWNPNFIINNPQLFFFIPCVWIKGCFEWTDETNNFL